MNTDELLPCPFCGSNESNDVLRSEASRHFAASVTCFTCELTMKDFDEKVTEKWNTRTNRISETELIDELNETLESVRKNLIILQQMTEKLNNGNNT